MGETFGDVTRTGVADHLARMSVRIHIMTASADLAVDCIGRLLFHSESRHKESSKNNFVVQAARLHGRIVQASRLHHETWKSFLDGH